jgi:signal transduction histidine kinase
MKMFNSLYWKISAVFFILLTIVGVMYIYISVDYSNKFADQVNQRLNRNTAKNILEHNPNFYNGEIIQPALGKLFDYLMIINPSLEVYLVDTSGKILVWYPKEKKINKPVIALEPVRQFMNDSSSTLIKGDDPLNAESQKVFSAAPIMTNGRLTGFLYVVLTGKEYVAATDSLLGNYLLQISARTMLITLVMTLLVGLLVIYIITKNYSNMLSVMQKFRQGDLNARIRVKSAGEVKQLADTFNEMADILTGNIEKLKEVENLRRELIANVSHDLRTPIAIIRGYLETLQMKEETLTPEERRQFIDTVYASSEKLEKLVNELFELSKLEANQVIAKKEPFIISELVSDISNKYKLVAESKNIKIETSLSKELPPVYGDLSLIERVLQNLIDNALKFTPDGGEIKIETTKNSDSDVKISVTDTGAGIPLKEREQIFSRYYKGTKFSDWKNNTGLGLAIAKKILDLHNSDLELISEERVGSSFFFRLPFYRNN